MGKTIVTYNDIIEINHLLEDKGLRFKLHLHDACGSQTFTIEPLGNCACEGHYEDMKLAIDSYFSEKGIAIRFLENNLEFVTE